MAQATTSVARSNAAPAAAAAPATQADPVAALAPAVSRLLDAWLVKKTPPSLEWLTTQALDERLLPAELFRASEYGDRVRANAFKSMEGANFAQQMQSLFKQWPSPQGINATSLDDVIAPIGENDDPDVWRALRRIDVGIRVLTGVQALAYSLRSYESFEWISPRTIGYRTILPEMIQKNQNFMGVVIRLRDDPTEPTRVFMFWLNEGTAGSPDWRLFGLAPVQD